MWRIDGGQKSGSGTIVRDAVSLAVLRGEELELTRIRAKREKPGLRPQHLRSIQAAVELSGGRVEGAAVGATAIRVSPGQAIAGGEFSWDIGSAGSTTMLALTVIPIALFARRPSRFLISGGLFQDFAPSVFHLCYVLLPRLKMMGAMADLKIIQPGYVPSGQGQLWLEVKPLAGKLRSLNLLNQGTVEKIKGIALSSHLEERKVSERMAGACRKVLGLRGYEAEIDLLYDSRENPAFERPSVQRGASLAVWAATDSGCLVGSDMVGAPRRRAEFIGEQTARNLLEDLDADCTVDRHLADQLVPFAALAEGWSSYLIPRVSEHLETRLWLIEQTLRVRTELKGRLLRIQGV
ncbi:MAG: RNA 3'-terminal phosphate cyclase, partial [Acidobacteriota bacterium]